MAEFLLKPNDFQGQIDDFKGKTETVQNLKYELEEDGILLRSIDKYLECIEEMNNTIKAFSDLANQDGDTMQKIKAKWMHTDGEIATKTVGEILGDAISGK